MDSSEPKEPCIRWGPDPTREEAILRRKGAGSGHARTCLEVDILKAIWMGQHRYGADVDWSVLDGMHISDA